MKTGILTILTLIVGFSRITNAGLTITPGGGGGGTAINALTDTFTSSGTTYDGGLSLSVTDTASASGSMLFDIKGGAAGTTRYFAVRKDGALQITQPFTMQFQDNTTTGGNVRGSNAFDGQSVRTAATQVASGAGAVLFGRNSTASGNDSVALGQGTTASSSSSVAIGAGNATGASSIVFQGGTASGASSFAAYNSVADATGAFAWGSGGTSRAIKNARTWMRGFWTANGDNQEGYYPLNRITTDATTTALTTDTAAAAATNQITMPNNSVYCFRSRVSARRTDSADYGAWEIVGAAKRDANAASTAILGTPTITTIATPSGAWTGPAVVADTTNGAIQITVTGAGSQIIRWMAATYTTEVGQ